MVMMLLSDQELMDIDAGGWKWVTRIEVKDGSYTFITELIWESDPPKPEPVRVPGRC